MGFLSNHYDDIFFQVTRPFHSHSHDLDLNTKEEESVSTCTIKSQMKSVNLKCRADTDSANNAIQPQP